MADGDGHEQERAQLCRDLGLPSTLLAGVQLQASELRAIAAQVRARAGGGLLVFGAGRDSPFWEAVNSRGTTAFVEDNKNWIDLVRPLLRSSQICAVTYGTRVEDWPSLIDRPEALALELSPEIASRQWDVILVDGPAGYRADSPGRMKPIFIASRLIAPGGIVFVHDSERPAEAAFSQRYLARGKLVVNVRGHARLKGYLF